ITLRRGVVSRGMVPFLRRVRVPPRIGILDACSGGSLVATRTLGAQAELRIRSPSHRQNERTAMAKYKLEYIWLDGYTPVPNLRGKTQIKEYANIPSLEQLPLWGFDGSSTMQA